VRKHYPRRRVNRVLSRIAVGGAAMLGIVGTIEVYPDPNMPFLFPLLVLATWAFADGCSEYKKILSRKRKKCLTNLRARDMMATR